MFQIVFDLPSALARFHDQGLAEVTCGWPATAEEAHAWMFDDPKRQEALARLSPCPRPEAEDTLLFHLLHALLSYPGPDRATSEQQDRAIGDLAGHMAWSDYAPPSADAPSAAYRLLDEALALGTFDLAFPHLAPHLTPTDQRSDRSLLKSWLDEADAGNPNTDITTCLQDHTPPEVVGAHLVQALFDQDANRFQLLAGDRSWPLPVAALYAAWDPSLPCHQKRQGHAQIQQVNLVTQMGALLSQGDEVLSPEVWAELFEACQAVPDVAPALKWAMASEAGQPNWQAWVTGQRPCPGGLEDLPRSAVTAAIVQSRQDPALLEAALTALGSLPTFQPAQTAFLIEIFWRQATRMRPDYAWSDLSPESAWSTVAPHLTPDEVDLNARLAQTDKMLAKIPLERVPGVAYAILDHALAWPDEFAALYARFAAGLAHDDQSCHQNLFRSALHQGLWENDPNGHLLQDLVPAEWIGLALVEWLSANRPLSPLFGDPLRWPLPVQELLRHHQEHPNQARSLGLPADESAVYRGLSTALMGSEYPEALRRRLMEACRPLRPQVAEDLYRSEERSKGLSVRLAAGHRSRSRV